MNKKVGEYSSYCLIAVIALLKFLSRLFAKKNKIYKMCVN